MLLRETGKSLIQHTFETANSSQSADSVIVAADDREIADEVLRFGGNVVLTDANHSCGTDRVAEVAARHAEYEIVVNVQGDEPELPGSAIDQVISLLKDNPQAMMATLATPIRTQENLGDPACVKVVLNGLGQAMYFSRASIPYPRQPDEAMFSHDPAIFYQHIGIYAYRRELLMKIPDLPRPAMESIECLEQLRVLYAGIPIHVAIIDHPILGIDTPDDYAAFVRRVLNR